MRLVTEVEDGTPRTVRLYFVRADGGYVGARTVGQLQAGLPYAFAYSWDRREDADAIAAVFDGEVE